ncbi:hypothetical protein [Halorubrum amylolyticum]|uniref:hypothetical protein n=1 Tax=Halorubrum amylolyticum TaxID=2508724 RepID=UPI0019D6DFCF|nr:hypothetical protein [Halorubrum amylolyticum]
MTANFAGREREHVIGIDRERDGDDQADRGARIGQWVGTVGFASLLLGASLIPVSWIAPADGSGSGSAGTVGALPLDIGFTDPFHLVGYAVLALLASRAIGRGRRGLLLAAGAAVAFGFGIELLQAPIPWRSFGWDDAAVNAVGAAVGLGSVVVVATVDARTMARERPR